MVCVVTICICCPQVGKKLTWQAFNSSCVFQDSVDGEECKSLIESPDPSSLSRVMYISGDKQEVIYNNNN